MCGAAALTPFGVAGGRSMRGDLLLPARERRNVRLSLVRMFVRILLSEVEGAPPGAPAVSHK